MNTDKLMELERKWRREAAALARNCDYTDSAVGQSIQMCADELAAALRAEQAVGDEQIARELLADEFERDGFNGSAAGIRSMDSCGNYTEQAAIRAIRRALGTARQSEGVVLVPRVPTEAMVAAARDERDRRIEYMLPPSFRGTWTAMIAAAPITGCDTRHAVTFYFNDKAAADRFRARQSEGVVLVPREPTEAMVSAMAECYDPTWGYPNASIGKEWAQKSYAAMIAAAPGADDGQ